VIPFERFSMMIPTRWITAATPAMPSSERRRRTTRLDRAHAFVASLQLATVDQRVDSVPARQSSSMTAEPTNPLPR
jgi:hypothetical protein